MDQRTLEICTILFRASGYVSQDDLCSRLNIRPRTLRDCMKEIRDVLLSVDGTELIQKSNKGYMLEVRDKEKLSQFLEAERLRLAEQEYTLPLTQEGRINYIIRAYLSNRGYQRYEDIADTIYASRTTVYSDLKTVREILAEYGLELESKAGYGLRIKGSEKAIRSCISDYFFHTDFSESRTFRDEPLGILDGRYARRVSRIVDEVLEKNHYTLTDVGRKNLKIHILIALFRIEADEAVPAAGVLKEERERNSDVYRIALELRERICETFEIDMPDVETDYLMIHLLGSRMFDERTDVDLIRPETMNAVREILTEVLNRFGMDFFSDIDLFTMLCMHIQPMIERLRNNVRMKNPLLEDIKEGNPIGFEMAAIACDILSRKYSAKADDEEIGYLALHFQLALERRKQNVKKKKILAVCASGAGTSKLLMFRIRSVFGDVIEQIRSAGLRDLETMDLSAFDLIVSTVPLNIRAGVPVIQVKYSLNENDVERMKEAMSSDDESVTFVRNVFRRELFFADQKLSSPKEVIHFLCSKLDKYKGLPQGFEASVLQREALSSTDLGLGIAMPHPMTLMMDESLVAVCHLRKGIRWGSQTVTCVFLIASRKEPTDAYTLFNNVVYALVNDADSIRRLNEEPSFDVLQQEIERLCVKQKNKTPESIFQ